MKALLLKISLLAVATPVLAGNVPTPAPAATPTQFIDTFAKIFGEHKGERKGHAKGFCVSGNFVGAQSMLPYSKSALFSGDTYPLTGRFSMAGGNPKAAENSRSPRGFAAQIKLNNGELQHFALLSTPMFGAKDPDSFLGLLMASIPDPTTGKADMAKIAAYRDKNPDTKAQADYLAKTAPPASYANSPYFGLHTFYLENSAGKQQAVRWQLQPLDGVKGLTNEEITAKPNDFLEQRLMAQLATAPVKFKLQFQLASAEDNLLDPSKSWPQNRTMLDGGELQITAAGGDACKNINFDPNVLASGISASNDPILQMRSGAYAVSFGKRLSGQ